MRKKFLAIYALVGAMVASPIFTSCIDSEESPTVTTVRKENAEKQKALAALAQAQAQAETLLANADAALTEAKTQAQLIANKKAEIDLAIQENKLESDKIALESDKIALEADKIALEADKIALEKQKKQAEYDLAQIQANIDKQAIEIEAALIYAQKNLMTAQDQMEEYIKNKEEDEAAELMNLSTVYKNTVEDLLIAKRDLAGNKATLVKLESDLADAKTELEKTITENNNKIALNNVSIEAYKKYANYTEDIETLKAEYTAIEKANDDVNNACLAAENNFNNAKVDEDAIRAAAKAVIEDDFYRLTNTQGWWDDENNVWQTIPAVIFNAVHGTGFYYSNYGTSGGGLSYDYTEIWGTDATIGDKDGCHDVEYTHDKYKATFGNELVFAYEATDLTKVELDMSYDIENLNADIKTWNENIKTYNTDLAAAKTAEAAAKKAWEEATETDAAAKKADYEVAVNDRVALEEAIAQETEYIESAEEEIADYEYWFNVLKEGDAALQEKIKAYNETVKTAYAEKVAAWEAYIDAKIAKEESNAEYEAVNAILYGQYNNSSANGIATSIKNLEEQNESLEKDIEEAKQLLSDHYMDDGAQLPYEDVIAYYQGLIEANEAHIAVLEIEAKKAKEALDAAMPVEEEEEVVE